VTRHDDLVLGVTGYIGTHTCVELMAAGYYVTVSYNFSNSNIEGLHRVERLSKRKLTVIEGDIRDHDALEKSIRDSGSEAIIPFAGLKAVGESVAKRLDYYDNNVLGTMAVLQAMKATNINTIVFCSPATVYGDPQYLPLDEKHPLSATNPYGRTKLMIEEILRDLLKAKSDWRISILRNFNTVGANPSGLIGEDPTDIPNNLMPFVAQVAVGKLEQLSVFGEDYPIDDDTGVRDYIHVCDLAKGHVKALEHLDEPQCTAINLCTGYSVLDIIKSLEKESGQAVPYKVSERRLGGVASCYSDPKLVAEKIGWKAKLGVTEMCRDHWGWQEKI